MTPMTSLLKLTHCVRVTAKTTSTSRHIKGEYRNDRIATSFPSFPCRVHLQPFPPAPLPPSLLDLDLIFVFVPPCHHLTSACSTAFPPSAAFLLYYELRNARGAPSPRLIGDSAAISEIWQAIDIARDLRPGFLERPSERVSFSLPLHSNSIHSWSERAKRKRQHPRPTTTPAIHSFSPTCLCRTPHRPQTPSAQCSPAPQVTTPTIFPRPPSLRRRSKMKASS